MVRFGMQVKVVISQMDLPNNPLDMLIDMLGGPSQVSQNIL